MKAGWAKLKELKREATEADLKKKALEDEAKAAGKGLWNPHGPKVPEIILFTASVLTMYRHTQYTTPCLRTLKPSSPNGRESLSTVSPIFEADDVHL